MADSQDYSKQQIEEIQQLIMKKVDGEISTAESERLEQLLLKNPQFLQEVEAMQTIKEETMKLKEHLLPDLRWDDYWSHLYNRLERGLSWMLLSIGSVILISFGLYHMILGLFNDTELPIILKGAIIAIIGGGVILLVSVIREKILLGKHDKYKEVRK